MCDGPSGDHENYTSLPNHAIIDVTLDDSFDTPRPPPLDSDIHPEALAPKRVKLLNLVTNEIKEFTVYIIAVLIGSKPDLHFLNDNFSLNYIDVTEKTECLKCKKNKYPVKRKIVEPKCFLKNHWHYLKCVIGQSIQSCKQRYLNYIEINGNSDEQKCVLPDCNKRDTIDKCTCNLIENDTSETKLALKECGCDVIPCVDKCETTNPYSDGIGFGIDEKNPVDCRSNPIAIDKSTHEMLNAPKGMYALGPLTADNFIRFIPGGALAIVAHIHKEHKLLTE